jgi:uncharacterized membrane protein HdeD (DUF308 family)
VTKLAREIISRIAMIMLAAILIAAGGIFLYMTAVANSGPVLAWFLGFGLVIAGVALIVLSFQKSIDTGTGDS